MSYPGWKPYSQCHICGKYHPEYRLLKCAKCGKLFYCYPHMLELVCNKCRSKLLE